MIRTFEIKDPANTHIPWMAKVAALATPRSFEFKPGLNILWGRNGSGKTTVIKALARLFHCAQGGAPVVTETSIRELFDRQSVLDKTPPSALLDTMHVDHDGQTVRYFDPSVAVGLTGFGGFDWDFGERGIANVMFKGSAGETTVRRVNGLLGEIIQRHVPEIERRFTAERVNDYWADRVRVAEQFLLGCGERGQPTVLLDEPERSFDLPHQLTLWRMIRAYSTDVQFIAASHTPFALNIPEAHYIEMSPGYLETSRRCIALLERWSEEKPEKVEPKETT